jgi:DNA-binding HxlR family transcriptional regulator
MPKGADGVCMVERRLNELSGRFRAELLKSLQARDAHFAALGRATGASAHSLTRALRGLEAAGLVSRRRETRWGPCIYALTESGRRTVALLDGFAT